MIWLQCSIIQRCMYIFKKEAGALGCVCLPINCEKLKWSWLVTDGASPCGFLLIHLQEEDSVETLEMRASQNSAWYTKSHLHQLGYEKGRGC